MNNRQWMPLSGLVLGLSCFLGPLSSLHAEPITYLINEFKTRESRCIEGTRCTSIEVTFPQFLAVGHSPQVIQALNMAVKTNLLKTEDPEAAAPSIAASMTRFLQEYTAFKQENPAILPWTMTRTVEVVTNQPEVLTLQYSWYGYTGGAHPNSSVFYWNFSPKTAQPLTLDNVFNAGYEAKLTQIAERYFRQARELKPDENLSNAGFWFEKGQFQINTNFALTEEGVTFHYNSYEIAPYVMGPTEFTIPYAELNELLATQYRRS